MVNILLIFLRLLDYYISNVKIVTTYIKSRYKQRLMDPSWLLLLLTPGPIETKFVSRPKYSNFKASIYSNLFLVTRCPVLILSIFYILIWFSSSLEFDYYGITYFVKYSLSPIIGKERTKDYIYRKQEWFSKAFYSSVLDINIIAGQTCRSYL